MSSQEPSLGYRLFSTPLSRNDPNNNYSGWVSGLPTVTGTSHPGGEGSVEQNQNLGSSGGGFHNHFTTPGQQQTQPENEMGMDVEKDAHHHPIPEYHSTPYIPSSFFGSSALGAQPLQNHFQQSQSRGTESARYGTAVAGTSSASAPNRKYTTGNNGSNQSSPQPQLGGVPESTPPRSFLDSSGSHFFRTPPPPTPIVVPTRGNPSLVSYPIHPLTRADVWNRFSNGPKLFATEGRTYTLPLGDGGVGDREEGPRSPLDSSFPPINRYLNEQYGGPITVTPRQAFTPRYHVLRACGQCAPIPIDLIFKSLDEVYKVNEGVFGEVYTGLFNGAHDESVYKLVPIEGTATVNGERQKRFDQIETEIRVSQRLNTLWDNGGRNHTEGFCNLYRARVLTGLYPRVLVQAWNTWHAENGSDNDAPRFPEKQLYIAFEYEHCGSNVESFTFRNAEQAYGVLLQVAFSLAVAELELDFEHRDLHWGNVLVTPINEPSIHYHLDGIGYQVPSNGLKTSIIDFTMARCNDEVGNPVFDDLHDDVVQFSGDTDYQFEIYRKMRQLNGNDWSEFHPRTNIFWLHYLADKFLKKASYRERISKAHKAYRNLLQVFLGEILENASCADYVKSLTQFVKPIGPPGSGRRA